MQARGYSTLIFTTLVSSYYYFKLLRHPVRRDIIFFVTFSVFGIYTHLYSTFVTFVQMVFLVQLIALHHFKANPKIVVDRKIVRTLFKSFVVIGLISLMLYLPVLPTMLRDGGARGSSDFNPLFPWSVAQELSGAAALPVVAVMLVIAAFGWFSQWRAQQLQAQYYALLILLPLLIMWLLRPFDLYPRFFAYWQPYYILFFIAGLRALWHLPWRESLRPLTYASRLVVGPLIRGSFIQLVGKLTKVYCRRRVPRGKQDAHARRCDSVTYCAIGGARSVWQYYINRPIVNPESLAELRKLSQTHGEVRCAYSEHRGKAPSEPR